MALSPDLPNIEKLGGSGDEAKVHMEVIIDDTLLILFNNRLKFPSILIIYQDVIVSIYGLVVIIGFADRQLFCSSDDVIESYFSEASSFCTFSSNTMPNGH